MTNYCVSAISRVGLLLLQKTTLCKITAFNCVNEVNSFLLSRGKSIFLNDFINYHCAGHEYEKQSVLNVQKCSSTTFNNSICTPTDLFRSNSREFHTANLKTNSSKLFDQQLKAPLNFTRTFCTTSLKHSSTLLSMCPHEFADFLRANKLNRCFLIYSDSEQKVIASHPELKEIEDWLNNSSNSSYSHHEAIFFNLGIRTGCLLSAFIWKVERGQACGGIRMSPYSSLEAYLKEGLRLSKSLGVKSALAGLWVGGGKGVIPEPKDRQHVQPEFRQKMFYDYGDFVSSLNGCYIAGMDVGVNTYDLFNVHSRTRWVICGPEDIGGSGNAAALLGRGVLCGMDAALNHLGIKNLSGLRVAVQGAGGIALEVISGLLERDISHIYVTDSSQKRVSDVYDLFVKKARGKLKLDKVPIGDLSILKYDCDIFIPCAVGHILSPDTIPGIKAKIICGAANSLLSSHECAKLIDEKAITYVLEYIPNRMALVNAVYENYGRLYMDPLIERHFDKKWEHSIYVLTKKVLHIASEKRITVVEAAAELAEEYSKQSHPLFPGRTKSIIQDLIIGQWHLGKDFWRRRRNFAKAEGCA